MRFQREFDKYKNVGGRVEARHLRIQIGGQGVLTPPPPPGKIAQILSFLAVLVRIPYKITKLQSQHSILGQCRHASDTPFKWRFAGGPMMARL